MKEILDRKGRTVEVGDILAFDVPVTMKTNDHETTTWDVFWGRATEEGVVVDFDPISQKQGALYSFPEESTDIMIIRKHVPDLSLPPTDTSLSPVDGAKLDAAVEEQNKKDAEKQTKLEN